MGAGNEEYKSALFKHIGSIGHRIDKNENPVILGKSSNDNKLLLKEMLHIHSCNPKLNQQKKSCFNVLFEYLLLAGILLFMKIFDELSELLLIKI